VKLHASFSQVSQFRKLSQLLVKKTTYVWTYSTGITNMLADIVSRPLAGVEAHFHLLETTPNVMCPHIFLTLLNALYLLPQKRPWTNVQPPSVLWSNVILMLHGQLLEMGQWTIKLENLPGPIGPAMPENAAWTRTSENTSMPIYYIILPHNSLM
jgi:hypothetical protein